MKIAVEPDYYQKGKDAGSLKIRFIDFALDFLSCSI